MTCLIALASDVEAAVQSSVGRACRADQLAGSDCVVPEDHRRAAVHVRHGGPVAGREGPVVRARAPGRNVDCRRGASCQSSEVCAEREREGREGMARGGESQRRTFLHCTVSGM